MANIVLGLGSSHGPTMRTPPADWSRLGEKDQEDPRYDYTSLFGSVRADIEAQLTPEVKQQRYDACQAAMHALTGVLREAAPDVIVVVSNPHGVPPRGEMHPIFGFYLNESESKLDRTGQQTGGRRPAATGEAPSRRNVHDYPTYPVLADHLMATLRDDGFDVACMYQAGPTVAVDSAFGILYEVYLPDYSVPMVPLMLSRYLPNQATPRRCYALGQALRRAIEGWDSDKRVAVMASGGLSHQILDEDLDRRVIDMLLEKDVEALCSLPVDRLNRAPGTAEILNWVTLAGTMETEPMTLVDYVPCYRSPAGTGHGVTFAHWAGKSQA